MNDIAGTTTLAAHLAPLPLLAVLRGITAGEVPAIGAVLADGGIPILEVPLNSPQPLSSIRVLADTFGHRCLVGAGTVLDVALVGSYAYVADGWPGLRIIDVSDPAHTREVGFYDTEGFSNAVAVAGAHAFMANGSTGLRVVDVTMPSK